MRIATDGSFISYSDPPCGGWAWQREDGVYAAGSVLPRPGEPVRSHAMEQEAIVQAIASHRHEEGVALRTDYNVFPNAWNGRHLAKDGSVRGWTHLDPGMQAALRDASLLPGFTAVHVKGHSNDPLGNWADYHAGEMARAAQASGVEMSVVGRIPVGLLDAHRIEQESQNGNPAVKLLKPMFAVTIDTMMKAVGTDRSALVRAGLLAHTSGQPSVRAIRRRLAIPVRHPKRKNPSPNELYLWDLKRAALRIDPRAFRVNQSPEGVA